MTRVLPPYSRVAARRASFLSFTLLALSACGDDELTKPRKSSDECQSFESTYEAIQESIFERHGCTESACHGSAAAGELDLRKDVAYANLFEVQSTASSLRRIEPGLPSQSFLYQKLLAATKPGTVEVAGSPMPSGLPPVSENELEALRIWITAGAPETGSVGDTTRLGSTDHIGELLGACLPPSEPISIEPLAPPADDEGIQLRMPPLHLNAESETEVCFATYYDLTDQIPEQFRTADGTGFYVNGLQMRQDPNSHHLIITNPQLTEEYAADPAFGAWTCRGGDRAGESCDPLALTDCGEGLCASEPKVQVTCAGYGPQTGEGGGTDDPASEFDFSRFGGIELAGAQTAQYSEPALEGVYKTLPIKGFMYFNAHAFNLTSKEHDMRAYVNVYYTDDLRFRLIDVADASMVYAAAGIPPFEEDTVCNTFVMPKGAELVRLSSHTHKRGKRFWVEGPDGELIYESLVYSDPLYKMFDPPLRFDAADEAGRSLHYCARFSNGLAEDGSADVGTVTRHSTMPEATSCEPVACVAGKVGAPCSGVDDDAACDSEPGVGDGVCDACEITAGQTSENEMFVLMPWYFLGQGD